MNPQNDNNNRVVGSLLGNMKDDQNQSLNDAMMSYNQFFGGNNDQDTGVDEIGNSYNQNQNMQHHGGNQGYKQSNTSNHGN